jgi:hypothetical protein
VVCSGAPALANCNPSLGTVMVTPATPGTFKVTVMTAGSAMVVPIGQERPLVQGPWTIRTWPMAVLALMIAGMLLGGVRNFGRQMRTVRLGVAGCLLLLAICGAMVMGGCAGGSGSSSTPPPVPSTPAGTYTLNVTATASGKSQSTALTLVVQ